MSMKRFDSQIDVLLVASGKGELAGRALITDVFRFLHEVMYKAARDQAEMLTVVEVLFGSVTMQRIAKTIGASAAPTKRTAIARRRIGTLALAARTNATTAPCLGCAWDHGANSSALRGPEEEPSFERHMPPRQDQEQK